jgi:hypothetical protein
MEKVSRLKFQSPGADDQVNRLLEVDALLAGLSGKQALWQMLGRVSASEPRLTEFDFDALSPGHKQEASLRRSLRRSQDGVR